MTVVPISSPDSASGAELVRYERPAAAVSRLETPALDSWVGVVGEVAKFADYVAMTEFVPSALRGKPAAITAAILAGREIGLGPMASMKHMQMVEGTPALSAEMARALVQARGHEIRFGERTKEHCIIQGRRRGEKEWTTVEWTIQDAREAGLLEAGKSGKFRPGWQRYKRRQLIARASAELCHMLFADCINGVAIAEEIEDSSDEQVTAAGAELSPTSASPRATQPQPWEASEWVGDVLTEIEQADVDQWRGLNERVARAEREGADGTAVDTLREALRARLGDLPASQRALKRMHTALTALGMTDEQRRQAAANTVGRELTSTSELTEAEADAVWRRAGDAMKEGGAASLLYEPEAADPDPDDYVDERSPDEIAGAS